MNSENRTLADRVAVVTGASMGLGRAIAEEFLRAGASLMLAARNEQPLFRARDDLARLVNRPGQIVEAFVTDVSIPENCLALAERTRRAFPVVHVLVNNAGVLGPIGRLEDIDWEEWLDAIRINLFGTVMMCKALVPFFKIQSYGKIINLSGGGATAPMPRMSAYAASKAAVVRFTETLAEEVREDHIDVNAVAPGALNTRFLDRVLSAGAERVGQEYFDRSLRQQAEGGAPLSKAAELVKFLASSESDGITGRLLSAVWDNWSALPSRRELLARSDIFTLRRIVPDDRGVKI
jgi:3-oxoacyl-[acyl-carrier protein] reductase